MSLSTACAIRSLTALRQSLDGARPSTRGHRVEIDDAETNIISHKGLWVFTAKVRADGGRSNLRLKRKVFGPRRPVLQNTLQNADRLSEIW
jgi:hypothetical protein